MTRLILERLVMLVVMAGSYVATMFAGHYLFGLSDYPLTYVCLAVMAVVTLGSAYAYCSWRFR